MELFIGIVLGIIAILGVSSYLILKWHDRVVLESKERAIEAGCPYFTSLKND